MMHLVESRMLTSRAALKVLHGRMTRFSTSSIPPIVRPEGHLRQYFQTQVPFTASHRLRATMSTTAKEETNFGKIPWNGVAPHPELKRIPIGQLTTALIGERVRFRARIHDSRAQGKSVFLKLRQRMDSIQGLVMVSGDTITKEMVKWVGELTLESIVLVEGVVQGTRQPVRSCSISDLEIMIDKIYLESAAGRIPYSLDDATRPEADFEKEEMNHNRVHLDTRLNNRPFDLRTSTNQAIFTLQGALVDAFRGYLSANGFTNIQSPKLQAAATESGASVFKVEYFKGNAYLAQSPQLAKQMAIAADFERVYEIGPVFRAENANSHRHMTEFVGVDLEMAIEEHYDEVVVLLDRMFRSIFTTLQETHQKEIGVVQQQFQTAPFKWIEGGQGTPRITFAEAVEMLVEDGVDRAELEDIGTINEKRLGRIVKEKYGTDYFIMDKFPLALRAFYTMPDPENKELSNSYDFFMRGEEILSGAQRVHDPELLIERMKHHGIEPKSMKGYLDAFRLGCPPHGGAGIGLERVLMLFLGLGNIRRASLFPRDPRRLEP